MNRFRMQALALIGASAVLVSGAAVASSPATATAGNHAAVAASKKKAKHKKKRKTKKKAKATGPSMSVIGFGINRLYAANGSTVKSSSKCDEIVGADGPIGPPQNVYLLVYLRASNIPSSAPTQIADILPEGDSEFDESTLSPPAPWSKSFAKGGFAFASPPGSQKDLFHTLILSASDEEGSFEGPSSEEFDGTYSYTVSVVVGSHTLISTAKVTVECPMLR